MRQSQDQNSQQQDQSRASSSRSSLAASPPLYKPLTEGPDCTRLLRIHAAKKDDNILTCSLTKAVFGDRPKFHALSYRWGDGPAECGIIINGIHFRTVVVWLGKGYAEYEAALPHLQRLGHDKPSNIEVASDIPGDHPRTSAAERRLAEELYKDEYWKRIWIIQEIGLAREIKVCFGNAAVEWNYFMQLIAMHNLGPDGPLRLKRQREERYTGSNTLLQLLRDHRDAKCKDRKDKVYGLVGMAFDARGFVIDYNKSLYEIWIDTMEFMNRHDLFAGNDVVSVGHLVKFLLMDEKCDPLQQILRPYEPGTGEDTIIMDQNHFKAFNLQAAILGCVIHVGPRHDEIVQSLHTEDEWKKTFQANYRP
ncbi:het domain protein [Fusarium beomiforme]|uniref:Het domain protein n=1 Tax=Fusarium beomiforme TaxID=44412 RepID=A0A9P5DUD4_9HYPO|nr:het domain protein [Fusarium beomiforme]